MNNQINELAPLVAAAARVAARAVVANAVKSAVSEYKITSSNELVERLQDLASSDNDSEYSTRQIQNRRLAERIATALQEADRVKILADKHPAEFLEACDCVAAGSSADEYAAAMAANNSHPRSYYAVPKSVAVTESLETQLFELGFISKLARGVGKVATGTAHALGTMSGAYQAGVEKGRGAFDKAKDIWQRGYSGLSDEEKGIAPSRSKSKSGQVSAQDASVYNQIKDRISKLDVDSQRAILKHIQAQQKVKPVPASSSASQPAAQSSTAPASGSSQATTTGQSASSQQQTASTTPSSSASSSSTQTPQAPATSAAPSTSSQSSGSQTAAKKNKKPAAPVAPASSANQPASTTTPAASSSAQQTPTTTTPAATSQSATPQQAASATSAAPANAKLQSRAKQAAQAAQAQTTQANATPAASSTTSPATPVPANIKPQSRAKQAAQAAQAQTAQPAATTPAAPAAKTKAKK